MSAGSPGEGTSSESQPEADPWSQPADFSQPRSASRPEPGRFGSRPVPWPGQPPSWPDASDGFASGTPTGFSPAGADPLAAQQAAYPPPGQWAYPPPRVVPSARVNPVAIAALVCGIGQFVLGLLVVGNILLAIPAIICGAIGLRQTGARAERGRSLAIAGLVLGILGVLYFLLIVLALVLIGLHNRTT